MTWQDHEAWIAKLYGGQRTPRSGGGSTAKGDVQIETDQELVECKFTGLRQKQSKPRLVTVMEKVANEAYEEGKDPAVALRYFLPESALANSDGYVDLVVRRAQDDARRSEVVRDMNGTDD